MTLQVINFSSKKDYERGLEVLGQDKDFIMIVSEEDCDELRRAGIKFVAGDAEDWLPEEETHEDYDRAYIGSPFDQCYIPDETVYGGYRYNPEKCPMCGSKYFYPGNTPILHSCP